MHRNTAFPKSLCCSIFPILVLFATEAISADHFVASGTETVDCRNFNGGVKAGDTLTLAGGPRGPLTIHHCNGSSGNPIIIRNDSSASQVVMSRASVSSGGFIFHVRDSEHFVIDGTGGYRGSSGHCGWLEGPGTNCGIKISRTQDGDSPTSYLKFSGLFRNSTVRGVQIDGRTYGNSVLSHTGNGAGIGIHMLDPARLIADHQGYWRESILLERNHVTNTRGEGMYIGPNYMSATEIPLRNVVIQDNYVSNVGAKGIALKSALDGRNIIQRNSVTKTGHLKADTSLGGIHVYDSSHAMLRNNVVMDTYGWCMGFYVHGLPANYSLIGQNSHFHAENNLGVRCGVIGAPTRGGDGIVVGARPGAYHAVPSVTVDYNTLVEGETAGIAINSEIPSANTFVRNNIVTTPKSGSAIGGPGVHSNNRTGSVASMAFVDPVADNYRLSSASPAISAGTSPFPTIDLDGKPRPSGGAPDQGAFEFLEGGVAAPKSMVISVD
jgi:hypothetical protein